MRALYDWTMAKARHRQAPWWLALISFLESSVFPVPPDVMLLPMVLAKRAAAFKYALICTLASVLGGLAGYLVGYGLWEAVGEPVIAFYGYEEAFARFRGGFSEHGALLVFLFGITFFPFKVITIASGLVAMDPLVFTLAALAARTPRFFLEAALLWRFGAPIQAFIEKRLGWLTSAFAVLLVAGFLAIKLL